MKEIVVVDSSCLIALERIGQLDVLQALFSQIVIPPEVAREFAVRISWLKIVMPADATLIEQLKLLVDDGEAEAIALAHERGDKLIVDDKQARAAAQRLSVQIIGTVGVLVRAKRENVFPNLKFLLDALEAHNFRISAALKAEALQLVGE